MRSEADVIVLTLFVHLVPQRPWTQRTTLTMEFKCLVQRRQDRCIHSSIDTNYLGEEKLSGQFQIPITELWEVYAANGIALVVMSIVIDHHSVLSIFRVGSGLVDLVHRLTMIYCYNSDW
jgi:hypothetical protein